QNLPPHCRLIAAQRAAGDAPLAALKEQVRPSALRAAWAANAALVAVRQNTRMAVAMISIVNLMARRSPTVLRPNPFSTLPSQNHSTKQRPADPGDSARDLHKNHACTRPRRGRVSIAPEAAYHACGDSKLQVRRGRPNFSLSRARPTR